MHRTTTTATLLVTMAVSALSGCTTVERPPTSDAPTAPSRPSAPRPSEHRDPEIVQAPAREALAFIGPSRRPASTSSAAHSASPGSPPTAHTPPAPDSHPHPRPAHQEPRRPTPKVPKVPPVKIPKVPDSTRPAVPKNTNVCALGKQYGGWRADSPESRICEQTYGH
ncbi:hypothetical protein ACFQ6E_28665 [Streptomyces sp. NPDC056462]|uniref:hypothetical protein n=1 Tax=Streptomyces sp. NPDC056462 TaxID=3345826 RepID=UPI0036CE740F